jgi:E1A/CREB-binding protein
MKVKSSEVVVNGSPRSRSKAKSILWLKNLLQSAGCVIFEGEKGSNVIDDCFQVPLPSLQKFSAAIAKESQNSNILSTLTFKNILRNICALRSEYVMRIAKPVLQKLMSHDRNRNTFNQPVDPVELGIPTYFETIKVPMDLGTVMSNLRGGRYPTIKACFNDIELVFFNAMTFNHASHEVHKMARDLLADFHAEVKAVEEKCLKEVRDCRVFPNVALSFNVANDFCAFFEMNSHRVRSAASTRAPCAAAPPASCAVRSV